MAPPLGLCLFRALCGVLLTVLSLRLLRSGAAEVASSHLQHGLRLCPLSPLTGDACLSPAPDALLLHALSGSEALRAALWAAAGAGVAVTFGVFARLGALVCAAVGVWLLSRDVALWRDEVCLIMVVVPAMLACMDQAPRAFSLRAVVAKMQTERLKAGTEAKEQEEEEEEQQQGWQLRWMQRVFVAVLAAVAVAVAWRTEALSPSAPASRTLFGAAMSLAEDGVLPPGPMGTVLRPVLPRVGHAIAVYFALTAVLLLLPISAARRIGVVLHGTGQTVALLTANNGIARFLAAQMLVATVLFVPAPTLNRLWIDCTQLLSLQWLQPVSQDPYAATDVPNRKSNRQSRRKRDQQQDDDDGEQNDDRGSRWRSVMIGTVFKSLVVGGFGFYMLCVYREWLFPSASIQVDWEHTGRYARTEVVRDGSWTQEGMPFSWRLPWMQQEITLLRMLNNQGHVRQKGDDSEAHDPIRVAQLYDLPLTRAHIRALLADPETLLQMVRKTSSPEEGSTVHLDMWRSVNGRPFSRLVSPMDDARRYPVSNPSRLGFYLPPPQDSVWDASAQTHTQRALAAKAYESAFFLFLPNDMLEGIAFQHDNAQSGKPAQCFGAKKGERTPMAGVVSGQLRIETRHPNGNLTVTTLSAGESEHLDAHIYHRFQNLAEGEHTHWYFAFPCSPGAFWASTSILSNTGWAHRYPEEPPSYQSWDFGPYM